MVRFGLRVKSCVISVLIGHAALQPDDLVGQGKSKISAHFATDVLMANRYLLQVWQPPIAFNIDPHPSHEVGMFVAHRR